jgi:hypothetical protein
MGRFKVTYPRQRDAASEARNQAVSQATQQRQAQASAYAAARFNEWAAGAQQREQTSQLRIQNLQAEAELKGAQFKYGLWKDNELRRQTTAYYTAMPALQEQLKQAGIYPGSQRYAAEMSAFAAEIPDAVTHNEAIRKDLEGYAKVDLTAEAIGNKVKTFQEGMVQAGQRPGTVHLSKEGEVSGAGTTALPEQVVEKYSKLQGKITGYNEASELEKQENMKANKANVPFSKAPELHASQTESSILERNYPELNASAQVAPQVKPAPQAVPIPSPTPQSVTNTLRRYNPETGELE